MIDVSEPGAAGGAAARSQDAIMRPPQPAPWPNAAQRAAARAAAPPAARDAAQPAARDAVRPAAAGISSAQRVAAAPPTAPAGITDPVVALPARPRIDDDPGLLGISRRSHGRIGARLFNLFFVLVFALILAQLLVTLLDG